jgi:hypothetical protein
MSEVNPDDWKLMKDMERLLKEFALPASARRWLELVKHEEAQEAKTKVNKRERVMGWGNCGNDSKGRPIGYLIEATCDHPGCKKKIDRGLSYACGDMHGEDEISCEGYFCQQHLHTVDDPRDNRSIGVCKECRDLLDQRI